MIAGICSRNRLADTARFHALLEQVEAHVGGRRSLTDCDGRMDWPRRGIYFFFEPGEQRTASGSGGRVVRVGTHALKAGGRTSLWNRLSQHRGNAGSGGGNHRGSIFRLIVGAALANRGDCPLPRSWGVGAAPGAAARKLNVDREAVKREEAGLERRVSGYIGQMPFLWLNIDDLPGPNSLRGLIERNAIALLSGAVEPAADKPSRQWLGEFSDRPRVCASGLWNNNHVDERYDPAFLDALEKLVAAWRG